MSVLTSQHASMPVAAMNPNCRNARNSVARRDEYDAADSERRDRGGLPGRSHGRAQRLGDGGAPTPLFEVARLVEDADVDAVAGDDADEKARRHVEVADDELGQAERPDQARRRW